jgi:nucleoside-diphosphate-sugar epimerase
MSASTEGLRVLVTGGAGFLGGRIAAALAVMPGVASVTTLDRTGAPGVLQGDVTRLAEALPPGFAADAVMHAAAITTQASESDPGAAWAINVEGTHALIAWCAAQARAPRLVLLSSVAVLAGGVAEPDEDSPPAPASTYGTTKAVAELLLRDATRRGWVDGAALRLPVSVIRTTRQGAPGAGYVSDLVRQVQRGGRFTVPLGAAHRLPVGSVRSAVALACRAVLAPNLPARLLHAPSLAVSGEDVVRALDSLGLPARGLVEYQPDPAVERLVAGWPQRLATRHPCFAADIAEPDVATLLRGEMAAP